MTNKNYTILTPNMRKGCASNPAEAKRLRSNESVTDARWDAFENGRGTYKGDVCWRCNTTQKFTRDTDCCYCYDSQGWRTSKGNYGMRGV
jgi:hypothetical protein